MKSYVLAAALIFMAASPSMPAVAQCAGCGADFNKADRARVAQEAAAQKDKAEKDKMRESLGNGMARDAADKVKAHNERNERALRDADPK